MKIFGIPVKIDTSFLIICAFLAYNRHSNPILLVEWLIVIFVSILIHELGHALMVRSYGLSPQILFYSMGGLTSWRDEKGLSHAKHIVISLAGPFAGFVFGGLVFLSYMAFPDLYADGFGAQVLLDLLLVNFGWGIFNLLPILPLDGGNVAHSIEQWVTKRPSEIITRAVSVVVSVAAGLLAYSVGELWIAILMVLFALINGGQLFKMIQYKRDSGLIPMLEQARDAIKSSDGAGALILAKTALSSAHSLEVKEEAQRILLQALIIGNEIEQARKEADRLQAVYSHEALLRALTGLNREQLQLAIPVIEYSYASAPSPDLNFIFVNALIIAGRHHDAEPLISGQQNPDYATASYKTLQVAAFHSGRYEYSVEVGRQAFERSKDPEVAYNIACAEARAGRPDEALAWVERALEAGFRDVESLASDPDFESLRSRPQFQVICGRFREA